MGGDLAQLGGGEAVERRPTPARSSALPSRTCSTALRVGGRPVAEQRRHGAGVGVGPAHVDDDAGQQQLVDAGALRRRRVRRPARRGGRPSGSAGRWPGRARRGRAPAVERRQRDRAGALQHAGDVEEAHRTRAAHCAVRRGARRCPSLVHCSGHRAPSANHSSSRPTAGLRRQLGRLQGDRHDRVAGGRPLQHDLPVRRRRPSPPAGSRSSSASRATSALPCAEAPAKQRRRDHRGQQHDEQQ